MDPVGRGEGTALEPGLRETAVNSVSRWQRRLRADAGQGGQPGALELDLIAREALQLRGLASARGAQSLAQYLEQVERALRGPRDALLESVRTLAAYLGLEALNPPQPVRPMAASGMQARPSELMAASGTQARPSEFAARLGESLMNQSLAEPPLLLPDVAPSPGPEPPRPLAGATMASAMNSVAGKAQRQPSRPPAVPEPPLPDDLEKPARPPALIGTILGLRAFGNKKGAKPPPAKAAPGPSERPASVLGLGARAAPRPWRSDPVPPVRPQSWQSPRGNEVGRATLARQRPARAAGGAGTRRRLSPLAVVLAGVVGLLFCGTALVIGLSGRRQTITALASSAAGSAPVAMTASAPAATTTADRSAAGESAAALTTRLHQRGKETPELRALLDVQGREALSCKNDPSSCGRGWTLIARDALSASDGPKLDLAPTPEGPLPGWLHRMKLPADFPIRDDVALRALFDLNTKNIAGRQRFQAKLFECAAYQDIFDSALVKYGAPTWLNAVVFQESACNPRATSPVGAKGLWQFMPESARAYGLRVVDGEVDDRLNPIKSTDAAVHFLTDLQRKLGAWDLALAAYNMGPYGVLARLERAGANAGFWELAHAGLLPEETAGYVPAIEAYALALNNLSRLQFSRDGKRLEATAEIVVKPGTRLSLIARAASTATLHIRELNPEFLRDVVPEGETSARVPDAEAHRAEAFMESWSPDDSRDTCVPEDFDWGAKQFDTSRFAKACPQTAAAP